ncbi:C2 calcium/lipid-binding region-containing protein [Cavenderia fasciculata]|uniref:C2 calcium/lipid-binding region-containing protein n=1 Tax=Cavenderia fasciculata TaxID=261658 RepID=F4PP17_CACFS|nr:C2 calcium/lipid-binding region-containing protein [Cavenderia fasciculata]EGG22130.1 C2 calcium/lipid-binding region-containing protein [Cavenderia fasciculata]|eukprot:XP_004359981.1 C2 calcium/lipid-binding region-containing protein [Cavenderia fasciculata]
MSQPGQYNYPPQQPPAASAGQYSQPGQYNYPPQPTSLDKQQQQQQQQQYQQQPAPGQYQQQQQQPAAGQYQQPGQYNNYPPQQQQQYGAPQGQYNYPPQAPAPQGYPGMNSGAYGYPQAAPSPYGYPQAPYGAPSPYGGYPGAVPSPYGVGYPSYGAPAMNVPVVGPAAVIAAPTLLAVDVNYVIHFKGCRLDRKDILSKSDPFFTLSVPSRPGITSLASYKSSKKSGGSGGGWTVVYRSETIRDNQNPTWAPFKISLNTLGGLERPLRLCVMDHDLNGAHDKIGSAKISLREAMVMKEIRLINKKRIGFGSTSGLVEVLKIGPE